MLVGWEDGWVLDAACGSLLGGCWLLDDLLRVAMAGLRSDDGGEMRT